MGNQGAKLENSALRSTAGSETHWLIFWHFEGRVVRLYHDIVGVILLLDGDVNIFQKVPTKDFRTFFHHKRGGARNRFGFEPQSECHSKLRGKSNFG